MPASGLLIAVVATIMVLGIALGLGLGIAFVRSGRAQTDSADAGGDAP